MWIVCKEKVVGLWLNSWFVVFWGVLGFYCVVLNCLFDDIVNFGELCCLGVGLDYLVINVFVE